MQEQHPEIPPEIQLAITSGGQASAGQTRPQIQQAFSRKQMRRLIAMAKKRSQKSKSSTDEKRKKNKQAKKSRQINRRGK